MKSTQNLRRQHDDAMAMSARLFDLIEGYTDPEDALPIIKQFNRLLGLLRLHLAEEDAKLYPRLIESGDTTIARMARTYVEEMGDLSSDLEIFARHWSCSASIATAFEEFRAGAHDLLLKLAVRIEREDRHLYPLVDAIPLEGRRAA